MTRPAVSPEGNSDDTSAPAPLALRARSDAPVTIEGVCRGEPLGKHFNLPGVTLKGACPKCGAGWECDMGAVHLHYPVAGEPTKLRLWCESCEYEWSIPVVVRVTLEQPS